MSDPVTTARSARESLARGLTALQSDPTVPPQLMDLAAHVAQAMGALHQIERSQGGQLQPHADAALGHVRTALNALQASNTTHPSVAKAMEAVAGSLGLVHGLVRQGPSQPTGAPAGQAPPMAFAPTAPAPAFPQGGSPQGFQPPPQQGFAAPPPQAAPPQAAPRAAAPAPGAPVPSPPAGDAPMVEAPLGAHSPTNFYKGLSGNDIVDHGGLFVSTYKIPKIGTTIRLKVSLPGGYEFEANAVVRWARDTEGGPDAPPGFGAQFTQITPEARQLVYRYVRNREPLFHDDL